MAAGDTTVGRRLPVGEFPTKPGEYSGPVKGYTGELPAVFFCPPNWEEGDTTVRHVTSPPHVFTEQPDGSLEIRESILLPDWHGYLDAGHVWREV